MKGGKRQGAGRKKGFSALEAEKAREFIAQKVSANLELITNALLKKAKKGDIRAIQILFDRALGKVAQAPDLLEVEDPRSIMNISQIVIQAPREYKSI